MTEEEVRDRLRRRKEPCDPSCPGWDVFLSGSGFAVERCDECFAGEEDPLRDDDVELLPEARARLRLAELSDGMVLAVEAPEDVCHALCATLAADFPGASVESTPTAGPVRAKIWRDGEPTHDDGLLQHIAEVARRFGAALLVLLVLAPWTGARGTEVDPWGSVRPLYPANMEAFRATKQWQETEALAWRVAVEYGLKGWARRLWLSVLWNESRGRHLSVGDEGCSWGLAQLQLGGVGKEGRRCADQRSNMPPELRRDDREAYLDPELNLRASAAVFRTMLGWKGGARPEHVLAWYAGCKDTGGTCATNVLGKHRWWWESGLRERVLELEKQRR